MSPQQKRLDSTVEAVRQTPPLLDEDMMSMLRQCDDPEYVPDTNLFRIMFDAGPDWAKYQAEKIAPVSEGVAVEYATEIAKDMTIQVQQEYDVCLPDRKVSQLYAMSHDFARLALGLRIPAPQGRVVKKGVVMHKKKIREYAKEQA